MSRRFSDNPIISYLQHHDWEWLTVEQIAHGSKRTPSDVEALTSMDRYKGYIEHRDGKIRYVSNYMSSRKRIVIALKEAYPQWLSSSEIQKRANLSKNVGGIIARAGDLLPIEKDTVYADRWHPNLRMYRYIQNDPRSLLEIEYECTEHKRQETKDEILDLLKKHPGVFFSAYEISARLGLDSPETAAGNLRGLIRKHPDTIATDIENLGTFRRKRYAYIPKKSARQKQRVPAERRKPIQVPA